MILVDMIGDRDLVLQAGDDVDGVAHRPHLVHREGARPRLHVRPESFAVEDDHVPFLDAGVPAVDLIDIDYRRGTPPGTRSTKVSRAGAWRWWGGVLKRAALTEESRAAYWARPRRPRGRRLRPSQIASNPRDPTPPRRASRWRAPARRPGSMTRDRDGGGLALLCSAWSVKVVAPAIIPIAVEHDFPTTTRPPAQARTAARAHGGTALPPRPRASGPSITDDEHRHVVALVRAAANVLADASRASRMAAGDAPRWAPGTRIRRSSRILTRPLRVWASEMPSLKMTTVSPGSSFKRVLVVRREVEHAEDHAAVSSATPSPG